MSVHLVIVATKAVGRPTRNGTKVHFVDATLNATVLSYDCGYHPDVFYLGITIVILVKNPPWIPGHDYYVTFDAGMQFLFLFIRTLNESWDLQA